MKGCIIAYDGMNLLSFAKIYDVFTKSGVEFEVVSFKPEIVDEKVLKYRNIAAEQYFKLIPDSHSVSLYSYEIVAIPDGIGALNIRYDNIFLSWVKSAKQAKLKVGVDLGILIFGGADMLDGKKATIRSGYKNAISEYCEYCSDSFCVSGDFISLSDNLEAWDKLENALNGQRTTNH